MERISDRSGVGPAQSGLDELDALLVLSLTPRLGPVRIKALLERFGSAVAVLEVPPKESRAVAHGPISLSPALIDRARACRDLCRRHGIDPVGWSEPRYPEALRSLHDPPPVLFVRGVLPDGVAGPLERLRSIAVVGTRDPSARARGYAVVLGREFAAAGLVVVSGLALGIDGAAHEGALEAGAAPPVAVLAGGLDEIRPAVHARLAERIVSSGGALVSEDPPGLRPRPHRFVARNRIVSGLAAGVVVVEAGARSGALHTVEFAVDQGRQVFAVPDHPTATRALGNLQILSDGAAPVTRPADVLTQLDFAVPTPRIRRDVPGADLLCEVGRLGPCTVDWLPGEPLENLVHIAGLEIGGYVARDGSGRYRLTHEGRLVVEGLLSADARRRKRLDSDETGG